MENSDAVSLLLMRHLLLPLLRCQHRPAGATPSLAVPTPSDAVPTPSDAVPTPSKTNVA